MNLSTSLICLDPLNLKSDVDTLINNGLNFFHADFMDGKFVPRLGLYPEVIHQLKCQYGSNIIIDSHLMISEPYSYIDIIAPFSDWVFIHFESSTDVSRTIQKIRKDYSEVKIGIAFNVFSSVSILENIEYLIDGVLLMGISPGVLNSDTYFNVVKSKIESIHNLPIFVDGSVNFKTIKDYYNLGVNTVICGSSTLLKRDDETINFSQKELINFNLKRVLNCIKQ